MFTVWAARMVSVMRASGCTTLIGVGQDEACTRIAPQFYASAVDYTTTHPWWNIDDLLWDMLLDKTPDKPNLIQETGVMQLRDLDNHPWRSEKENAFLLERKLITGLIARSAGLIQWLWHVNGYMTNENENSIGLVHVDGSGKPELQVMQEFGRLTSALTELLPEAYATPDLWVIVPYAQWFARPELGREGLRQAVRTLGHELGVVPQFLSEYHLAKLDNIQPRAILLPAAQFLAPQVWQQLLSYVKDGGRLLINGVISRDHNYLPSGASLDGLLQASNPVPVARYEHLDSDTSHTDQLTFADEKISYVKKDNNKVQRIQHGAGLLIWCGLPLELAGTGETLQSLYAELLDKNTTSTLCPSPYLLIQQGLRESTLWLAVSESSKVEQIILANGLQFSLEPGRAGAVLLTADKTLQMFGGLHE
jgi:hypothetical protein